jgi:hypothetical protein
MKIKQSAVFGLVIFLFFSVSVSAQSGLILDKKITKSGMMARGGSSTTATVHITEEFIRNIDAEGREEIIHMKGNKLISIDHKKKKYSEITFAELNAKLEEATARMSNQDNAQAMEAMKKMMGGAMGEISVEKEGPGGKIAGYSTQKYKVTMAPLTMYLWAAPEFKVPDAYYDSMKMRVAPNPMFDMSKMFESFKQIQGYPLKSETVMKMMGMEGKQIDEVVKVTKENIPSVSIPTNYKKVPYGEI